MHERCGHFSYLVDLHKNKRIIAVEINLMAGAYRSCDCLDNIVPFEILVVPNCWSNRKLWFHGMLANMHAIWLCK